MVMIPFHPLMKDARKEIREVGRYISPTNLLKVISLGEKRTISDFAPPEQTNTCMITVLNGQRRNNCSLEHQ